MTEPEITDASSNTERGASGRGAGFPAMDLATALELIHKVGEHGGEFSQSAFAQYLGHTTANSGPYRTKIASLKDWALVAVQGGRVLLTDLGKDVAKSPDPMADQALLRAAFDSCKIFKAFYDDTAKGVPLKRDTLRRAAVFDHKVSAKSQDKFVSMLVDSAVAVGLATPEAEGTVTFKSASQAVEGPRSEDLEQDPRREDREPDPARDGVGAPPRRQQPARQAPSDVPVLLRQVWPTAAGEIVLAVHSTDPLPASAFGLVGKVVQAAEDLAKSIGLPAAGDPAELEGNDAS